MKIDPPLGGASGDMVIVSPIPGVRGPLPSGPTPWLVNGGAHTYLLTGMILQVSSRKMIRHVKLVYINSREKILQQDHFPAFFVRTTCCTCWTIVSYYSLPR